MTINSRSKEGLKQDEVEAGKVCRWRKIESLLGEERKQRYQGGELVCVEEVRRGWRLVIEVRRMRIDFLGTPPLLLPPPPPSSSGRAVRQIREEGQLCEERHVCIGGERRKESGQREILLSVTVSAFVHLWGIDISVSLENAVSGTGRQEQIFRKRSKKEREEPSMKMVAIGSNG